MSRPSPAPITFVVPGDLHLTGPGLANHRTADWVVDEVNSLVRPDFVQFIGDNVQDATEDQFDLFDAIRNRLEVPHHVLVGDHDVKDDPEARAFHARVGPTYGATRLPGVRLIRLDTQEAKPVGLAGTQIGWLRDEIDSAVANDDRVLIFQHNYPYQIWESFAGPGVDAWREVVQTRPVAAIVCGHTHYGQVANDGRNVVVAVRSIGDPEGGPPGYTIGHLDGDDLAFTFRAEGDVGPIALVTHPRESLLATGPRHVVSGADQVRVRTWSAAPMARVRGRVDGGDWFPLDPSGPDTWTAPLPGASLDKGVHTLEVEAADGDGRSANSMIEFVSDPTGRYTAVPDARPRVTRTAFC